MTALTLYYHPLSSYCWKALVALNEHGVDYGLRQVDPGDAAVGAELAALWPMQRFPVLVDAAHDVVLPETSIIIEYVTTRHPGAFAAIPADRDAALEVRLLDRLFDNDVMTPMQQVVFEHLRPEPERDAADIARARAALRRAYDMLEARLAGRAWAAGDAFTMVDCAAMPSLHYADKVEAFRATHPWLGDYLARLEARPSVVPVLAAAAPYAHFFPVK
ncbi:glutathione S-transferase [Sphingomonas zeicaulis]|uniref:glutathione S-transferase family protein n=1 Tax=Sphingomonas zeicaulis TaxID=1632740 RepID=UPI003D1C537C